MLPFETVKASGVAAAAGGGGGAGRSGARRPHTRGGLSPTRGQSPSRNNHNNNSGSGSGLSKSASGLGRSSPAPQQQQARSIFSPISSSAAAAPVLPTTPNPLTSPLKPSSARAVAAGRGQSPTNSSSNRPRQPLHADAARKQLFDDAALEGRGVAASEVVPDVQLCVNYKKVDITVNDAKKHLRVRPPRIKAAVSELSCSTCEVFEYPNLFSVDCGLGDVGVDHSVLFFVVTQNPECFAVAPTVDCEGTLRFETAPPAPGSVHLDGTSMMVTAWDALSLTGSAVAEHADEVEELEQVPFCSPIKLTLRLSPSASHQQDGAVAPHAGNSASLLATNNSPSPNRNHANSNGSSTRAAHSPPPPPPPPVCGAATADGEVRFPRLNPNMLRDPFVVLGAQLQERLVGATPCPLTDTEVLCLPFVRDLFFGSALGPDAIVLGASEEEAATLDEAALRAEVEKNTASTRGGSVGSAPATDDHQQQQRLASALERLGRFILERGAAQGGDGTVVEVMEQLVSVRRRMMRAAGEQQPDRRRLGAEAMQLLLSLNCLAAAEVAAGSLADASSTLDNAVQLAAEFAPVVDDPDAAWILLRACYVALVRGDAEGALRMLRRPAIAEADTVFPEHLALRTAFHVLGACARCGLARYGEAMRRLKQTVAGQQQLEREIEGAGPRGSPEREQLSDSLLPLTPLRQALVLACIRAGDMQQARQILQQSLHVKLPVRGSAAQQQQEQEEERVGQDEHETNIAAAADVAASVERCVTYLLMNMSNLHSEMPEKLKLFLQAKQQGSSTTAGANIFRSPTTVVRAVDVWQALSLDPHNMAAREFLATHVGSGAAGGRLLRDLIHVKLRLLDAAVSVATSPSAVAGTVDRQRAAAENTLQRLRRELAAHHRDVVAAAETLAWLLMCAAAALTPMGGAKMPATGSGSAAVASASAASSDISRFALRANKICDLALRDILAFGVDVNNQTQRICQLMCHASGALGGFDNEEQNNNNSSSSNSRSASPAAVAGRGRGCGRSIPAALNTATQEALDETMMRYGDGTRALFTPLVDRAMAEINANMFQPALEKLHKALKIVDSGNAIFLLGPLFRPAAQLTLEELAERTRLSRGRVDARAAQDFAVVLFAMAAIAEAEGRLFDAETLLLQVLAALELAGVEDTISTAAVYRSMSQLLFEDGHFGDSLAYVERAEKLLHTKFPFANKLRGEVQATQQFIEFQIRSAGYSLKRMPDTRFKFAVFV